MEKAPLYIPIFENLKDFEDRGLTTETLGQKRREAIIDTVMEKENLDKSERVREVVGFACNDLVSEGYITSSEAGFGLTQKGFDEIGNNFINLKI